MKKGQVIELDNGKLFLIAEVIELFNDTYLYIVNLEDNRDICFVLLKDNKISLVKDNNLINSLMLKVTKKLIDK